MRARFLVLPALALGLAGLGACRDRAGAAQASPARPGERVVTLVATAEVKGTPEPCGCTSDPLGDVSRVATLAKGALLLDAGSLIYDEVPAGSPSRAQSDLKAARLASIYEAQKAELGLGEADLSRGPKGVLAPRNCANAPAGVATVAPHVRELEGVKVGVFGVASAKLAKDKDPVAAAQAAVSSLKGAGAQVIVALLGMPRDEARALLQKVTGIGFGVVGAEVGDGMQEAEPVNGGFLVAPADQAQRVARIELHVLKGQVALTPFAGDAARRVKLARDQRRIKVLTLELATWKNDPTADQAFVAARAKELSELVDEAQRLERDKPQPPDGSYFTYGLEPVTTKVPRDAAIAAQLRALAKEIGQANLAAAQKLPEPVAEKGKATYVGMAACGKCHHAQVDFWKKTVHAQAWKTLVEVDKQYNYDCTSCHVTGLHKPGGATLATVEKRALVNVQCEVCHGPGSIHVEEAGTEEPLAVVRKPPDGFCAENCHTKEHSDTFQLVPYLRDILGKGHGEKRRKELGEGVTGHELRARALQAAR